MYEYRQVVKCDGGYQLPGNIYLPNCISVSFALNKLGLTSSIRKNHVPIELPQFDGYKESHLSQTVKGTKAHNNIKKGKKTPGISDLYFDAVQARYANYKFHSQEVFVWSNISISPIYYLIGVCDALLTDDTNVILVEWKTTSQDSISSSTLERALGQVCLYNYMLFECYDIKTNKVSVVPLHEGMDLKEIYVEFDAAMSIASELLSCLKENKKYMGDLLKKIVNHYGVV